MLFQRQTFLGLFNQIGRKLSSSHLSLAFTSKAFWKIICTALIWAGVGYHCAATKEWAPSLCFLSDTGYRLPHYLYFLRKWENSIHSSSCWKIMHELIMPSVLNHRVFFQGYKRGDTGPLKPFFFPVSCHSGGGFKENYFSFLIF